MMKLAANKIGSKECYTAQVGTLWLGFSYATCVAASFGGVSVKRKNVWGQTTGRHLTTLGITWDAKEVDEAGMEAFILHAMYEMGKQHPLNMLGA